MRGRFITFEGGEGAGKSTQARHLLQRLKRHRISAIATREPGGTTFGEAIRSLLLDPELGERSDLAEVLLFYAARANHLNRLIRPALERGDWIVCDRFSDSTRAYQGASGGVDAATIETIDRLVVGSTQPDLTFILDLSPAIGHRRATRRAYGDINSQSKLFVPDQLAFSFAPDRFEALDLTFHEQVRNGFQRIAESYAERCVVIDASASISVVADAIWHVVAQRFDMGAAL